MKFVEVPTPHPQDHEVRVKVLVCGVCRTDIHLNLAAGTSLFPFEDLQDALVLARRGQLEQPNAVIDVAGK